MENKPTFSPSRLGHYLRCPRAFELSREEDANISDSTLAAMREGNLFEGYVFGFKPTQNETELIGRKKKETIDVIKGHAKTVKPTFLGGEPYKFVSIETERSGKMPGYIVRGECDFVGEIDADYLREISLANFSERVMGKCIVDLKYTGDVSRVWDFKNAKEEYLQSVFYPYIWWKNTGELLPFVYIVVDSRYKTPIVRAIEMKVTIEDFTNFVEPLLAKVAQHTQRAFMEAKPSREACLGDYGGSQCWFLEYCEYGRRLIGGWKEFEFASLYNLNK